MSAKIKISRNRLAEIAQETLVGDWFECDDSHSYFIEDFAKLLAKHCGGEFLEDESDTREGTCCFSVDSLEGCVYKR